jgi:hypothetical protein
MSVLACAAVFTVGLASAQTALAPGGVVSPVPAVVGSPFDLGTVIAAEQFDFVGHDVFNNVVFTGYLYSTVIQQGSGDLVFGYILGNYGGSQDPLGRLSITDFSGFSTAVAQGTPWNPPYPPVDIATRSSNGRVVSFDWLSGVQPGVEARFVYVFTDAKAYKDGSASVLNGGIANVSTYAPAPVPEPASIAALGLGAVALIRRRRQK